MRGLDGGCNGLQIALRYGKSPVRRRQDIVDMLSQLTCTLGDP